MGEGVEVAAAMACPVVCNQLLCLRGRDAVANQSVSSVALAGGKRDLGPVTGLDEITRDAKADHPVLPALLVVGSFQEPTMLEFLEARLDLLSDLRVVAVALGHRDELAQLLDAHRPGKLAASLGIYELVEALCHGIFKREEEVSVKGLEKPRVIRADQDFVELQDVSLCGATLALPGATEVHAPGGEAVGAELFGLVI